MNNPTTLQPIPNGARATVTDDRCGWKVGTVGRVYDWSAYADGTARALFYPLAGGASAIDAACLVADHA